MAKIVAKRNSRAHSRDEKLPVPAYVRILICLALGAVCGIFAGLFISWEYAPLVLWDVTGVMLCGWLWYTLHDLAADETEAFAVRENPGRAVTDVILILASIASLGAVGALLYEASNSQGLAQILELAFGIISIVISWATVHTVYMLRYASEYFSGNHGASPIDFNSSGEPTYSDFAYLAFTIGMTYQVSDTTIQSPTIRRLALKHALLSFVFGTAIIASTINLIAGLGK